MLKTILKTLKYLSILIASIYAVILFLLYFNQESLFFHPSKLEESYKFIFSENFEEVKIKVEENTNLHGLLFKVKQPKGLVFYLHGNTGTVDVWGNIASIYNTLNYDFFALDYRGYGKSNGEISSENQLHQDVALVYAQLKKQYPENKIIVIGYSIGSGLAAKLASQNKPKALVLQAPYYCLQDLALQKVPFVPGFVVKYEIPTYQFFPQIKCPITIFHGTDDGVIPFENALKLKSLLKQKDKLFVLQNYGHLLINENEVYLEKLPTILN